MKQYGIARRWLGYDDSPPKSSRGREQRAATQEIEGQLVNAEGDVQLAKGRSMKRLALLLLLTACPKPTPGPTPIPAGTDAAPTCDNVCAHLGQLGCSAAQPTPAGASCADVCSNLAASGAAAYNLPCMLRATSCAAVDACR